MVDESAYSLGGGGRVLSSFFRAGKRVLCFCVLKKIASGHPLSYALSIIGGGRYNNAVWSGMVHTGQQHHAAIPFVVIVPPPIIAR